LAVNLISALHIHHLYGAGRHIHRCAILAQNQQHTAENQIPFCLGISPCGHPVGRLGGCGGGNVRLDIMAHKKKAYKKLPGRSFTLIDAKTLWQGDNHLLYVESLFFRESYKRFDYNDIQTIILQRTGTHLIWSFTWGALALLFGIIAFLVPGPPYVSGTFFSIFILALVANLMMGPSCIVYLQTAVQLQKLSSLRRVRTACKAMTRMKSLIEEKQGPWEQNKSVEAQKPVVQTSKNGAVRTPDAVPNADVMGEQAPKGPYNALLHQILFGLFTFLGMLGAMQLFLKSLPLGLLETLVHSAVQIMVIVALVRWFRHLKGTLIAKFNWLALVFIVVQTIIGYGLYMLVSIRNPEINYHHWAMFKMIFEMQMSGHPVALAGNIIFSGGSLLLGAFGLLVVQRCKQNV
jgi:hypothetical protein